MGGADELTEPPSPALNRLTGRARRKVILLLTAAGIALLVVAYLLRAVVGPLLLALSFAYVLEPLVQLGMVRLRISRAVSVFLVFFLFLAIAGVGAWYLVQQGIALSTAAIGTEEEKGFIVDLPAALRQWLTNRVPEGWIDRSVILERLEDLPQEWLKTAAGVTSDVVATIGSAFGTLFTLLSFVVLFPIYLYYFMLDLPKVWEWIKRRLPGRHRDRILALSGRVHQGLSAFLRGRVVIAILKGFLTAAGLMVVGIPYAFAVGMLAGVLSILPFVGAALGLLTSVILVLVEGLGAGSLIGVVVVFVVAEALEGYVLYPWILAEKLDMHPVTMLFSVLAWGTILGIFGVLVAIPLTIVVRALAQELLLKPLEALADEE